MAQVTIATGFDVDYYLDQVGADYYLTAAGEPPGIWGGSAAPGLGLVGQVDPDVMRALYHHDTAPGGVPLGTSQRGPKYAAKRTYQQVQENIDKRMRDELGELAAAHARPGAEDPPGGAGEDPDPDAVLRHDVQRREVRQPGLRRAQGRARRPRGKRAGRATRSGSKRGPARSRRP